MSLDADFLIITDDNRTGAPRVGLITITAGTRIQTVTVVQHGNPSPVLRNTHSHVMLAMSMSSYNRNDRDSNLSRTRICQSNWVFVSTEEHDFTGFGMNVYRRSVGGGQFDYAFAFRGTESRAAWENNIYQTLLNNPFGQIQVAEAFVDRIISDPDISIRNVYFTGHSLGGYLSQWMQARIHDGHPIRGSDSNQATTFNAPGLIRPATAVAGIPGTHQNTVLNKINNRTRYDNITNYHIARRDGRLRVADPVAMLGSNLGETLLARSVNIYGDLSVNYHDLSEFFDITGQRRDFVE